MDQTGALSSNIETVYMQAIEKARAHLTEYQRQRQMAADLVAIQESTLERQSTEVQGCQRELESQELVLEEAQRKLKDATERKNNANDLNDMDLKNLKVNAERLAIERMQ